MTRSKSKWAREDRDTEAQDIRALRLAGCKCINPLHGFVPGYGPRCRLCNTVVDLYTTYFVYRRFIQKRPVKRKQFSIVNLDPRNAIEVEIQAAKWKNTL